MSKGAGPRGGSAAGLLLVWGAVMLAFATTTTWLLVVAFGIAIADSLIVRPP